MEKTASANGINIVAGIWLIVFPFIFGLTSTAFAVNNYIFGIVVLILALIGLSSAASNAWAGWLNAIAGLWVFISAFVYSFTMGSFWNNIIVGLVVIVLSVWSAMVSSSSSVQHPKAGM